MWNLKRWNHRRVGHTTMTTGMENLHGLSYQERYREFVDPRDPNYVRNQVRKYCTVCEKEIWQEMGRSRLPLRKP